MSPERTVEASGETVSEAKWRALRELELAVPGLDKAAVRFQVLSEGERGLLGVGYTPARVVAAVAEDAEPGPRLESPRIDESEAAGRLRELLAQITSALGVRCRIEVEESDAKLAGTCSGDDLGLLIGRHGQTIDAIQVLAAAIAGGSGEARKEVVVDAAGYRERRRHTLEAVALRSAEEALRTGSRVELEPMSSAERKIVHTSLEHHEDITTSSEGDDPNRYVVVEPIA